MKQLNEAQLKELLETGLIKKSVLGKQMFPNSKNPRDSLNSAVYHRKKGISKKTLRKASVAICQIWSILHEDETIIL